MKLFAFTRQNAQMSFKPVLCRVVASSSMRQGYWLPALETSFDAVVLFRAVGDLGEITWRRYDLEAGGVAELFRVFPGGFKCKITLQFISQGLFRST